MPSKLAEERPQDPEYYVANRIEQYSQGDVFSDVPREYPTASAEVVDDQGVRRFISGPLEVGYAMLRALGETTLTKCLGSWTQPRLGTANVIRPKVLTTPTCSMRAQGAVGYAHRVRTLVPLVPLDEARSRGIVERGSEGLARKCDELVNYMWMPPLPGTSLGPCLALLYMPVTMSHEFLAGTALRVCQLTLKGARQLQRKLVLYDSGLRIPRAVFHPAMD